MCSCALTALYRESVCVCVCVCVAFGRQSVYSHTNAAGVCGQLLLSSDWTRAGITYEHTTLTASAVRSTYSVLYEHHISTECEMYMRAHCTVSHNAMHSPGCHI